MNSMNSEELVQAFISKFNAKVVIPWDSKLTQVEVGPTRVVITARAQKMPPGTECILRLKDIVKVLERDVFDIPALIDAELLEQHYSRSVPVGMFRPKGGVNRVIYPTGILAVDKATGIGGFYGKIMSRIWGASTGGKSIILYMAMITAWHTYRKRSLLINPEYDFDEYRFSVLPGGAEALKADAIDVYEPGSGDDAYDKSVDMMSTGDYGIIGLDSMTPLKSASEMEKGAGDAARVAQKAGMQTRFIEDALPHLYHQSNAAFIVIVQSRRRITTGRATEGLFEPSGAYAPGSEKQAAGNALQFYTQISLKVNPPVKVVYDNAKNMIGHLVTGVVDKNKHAPQGMRFEFPIDYTKGLDQVTAMINTAVMDDIIILSKTRHIIPAKITGTELVFKNNKECRAAIEADRDLARAIYTAILCKINPNFKV